MVLRLPGPAGAAPAATAPAAATTVTAVGTITVHPGDTLTSLAAHYGTLRRSGRGHGISNPNIVFAGMVLKLPAPR